MSLSSQQEGRVRRTDLVTRDPVTRGRNAEKEALLEVKGLKMHFPIRKGLLRRTVGQVKAVDDVSFTIHEGETLGLVGESGCGKTTTGRCLLRVYEPTAGEILYHREDGKDVDLMALSNNELKPYRREIRWSFRTRNRL